MFGEPQPYDCLDPGETWPTLFAPDDDEAFAHHHSVIHKHSEPVDRPFSRIFCQEEEDQRLAQLVSVSPATEPQVEIELL